PAAYGGGIGLGSSCWLLLFFSSRRRHTRFSRDWSSDVCSSDLCWPSSNGRTGRSSPPSATRASRLERPGQTARLQQPAQGRRPQIGRASCRERVETSEEAG